MFVLLRKWIHRQGEVRLRSLTTHQVLVALEVPTMMTGASKYGKTSQATRRSAISGVVGTDNDERSFSIRICRFRLFSRQTHQW